MVTTMRGPPCLERVMLFDSYSEHIRIADSLTNTALTWKGLRTRFFDLYDKQRMHTEEGYNEVMDFLRKEHQEPEVVDFLAKTRTKESHRVVDFLAKEFQELNYIKAESLP